MLYQYFLCLYTGLLFLLSNDLLPATTKQVVLVVVSDLMGAFMVGLMFGEIAVLFGDLTARDAAFQMKYDNACSAMQNRKLQGDLQDRIIIYQKSTREAEEHEEDLQNFITMIAYVYR